MSARGQCPGCGCRVRLLKNGETGWHEIYVGDKKRHCPGVYQQPKPRTTTNSGRRK